MTSLNLTVNVPLVPRPPKPIYYESRCGACGDMMLFQEPLKGPTRAWCRICNQTVTVY